jgi:hypothetical protein
LAFLYKGQATYAYVWDDEATLFAELQQLTEGKGRIGVVRWKVSKHTGADPKQVFDYALKKNGVPDGRTTHKYFDVDYYRLGSGAAVGSPAALASMNISFEDQLTLVGMAMDADAAAGELIWIELA